MRYINLRLLYLLTYLRLLTCCLAAPVAHVNTQGCVFGQPSLRGSFF